MNQQQATNTTIDWLNKKYVHRDNGIIIEGTIESSLEASTNFIEALDVTFKTPAIYYRAFPQESAVNFFDTLRAELVSKLGEHKLNPDLSLNNIIELAELKIVIIDKFYLYSIATLSDIVNLFASCQVNLILISAKQEIQDLPLMSHPIISQWDKFSIDCQHESLSTTC